MCHVQAWRNQVRIDHHHARVRYHYGRLSAYTLRSIAEMHEAHVDAATTTRLLHIIEEAVHAGVLVKVRSYVA